MWVKFREIRCKGHIFQVGSFNFHSSHCRLPFCIMKFSVKLKSTFFRILSPGPPLLS